MTRRPPISTLSSSSAASDVYKRQLLYRSDIAGAAVMRWHMVSSMASERESWADNADNASSSTPPVPLLSLIHISEPTRLLSISYAVFCLKKKNTVHETKT
eukprot:TRINITY_DN43001_c0_g1_i1.p1 TRINITY_DN43001_c0_g1~~TRINITY_DN43001_c0_g1_i1.p1  ORF type:complete len:101 (-),score=16.65 TRINITY_DN43001_c0_g1_i1:18-320(-)